MKKSVEKIKGGGHREREAEWLLAVAAGGVGA